MKHLTYEEYLEKGGFLDGIAFDNAYCKAVNLVNSYTFGRFKQLEPNCITNALLFELIHSFALEDNSKVQSQSNDGVSVTYKTDTNYKALRKEIIREFLSEEKMPDGTPLLYCGVS